MRGLTAPIVRACRSKILIVMLAFCASFAVSPGNALADDAPDFFQFNAVHIVDDWWIFSGEFEDEKPQNCTVYFSGMLDGESCPANNHGSFDYLTTLSSSAFGIVSAEVHDQAGNVSNTLSDVVDP